MLGTAFLEGATVFPCFLTLVSLLGSASIPISTPQKSSIDTKNGHILKESTFSKPSFWVSMLVLGEVTTPLFGSSSRMKGETVPSNLLHISDIPTKKKSAT